MRARILLLVVPLVVAACSSADPPPPNILFVVLDTARADHFGLYGYGRATSPLLDELAARSFVFDNAQSAAPWTAPSLLSMMTSLYPDVHQVRGFPTPERMSDEVTTLAEILRAHGYATAAFTEGGYAKADFGLGQGFDLFPANPGDDEDYRSNLKFPSRLQGNLDRLLAWLDERDGSPFFALFHTYEPHFPYRAPERFIRQLRPGYDERLEHQRVEEAVRRWNEGGGTSHDDLLLIERHRLHCDRAGGLQNPRKAFEALRADEAREPLLRWMRDIYDAEIAYTDDRLGLLWEMLRESGLDGNTIVVVVSDHGEGLGDHGEMMHGEVLHEELLRMVLLVRAPGEASPRRIPDVVRAVDLLPTILELAGVPGDGLPLQGRSLVPLMRGESASSPAFSHARQNDGGHGTLYTIRDDRWRLLVDAADGRYWLYDLDADPGATVNVGEQHEEVAVRLRDALVEQMRRDRTLRAYLDAPPARRDLDEETLEELRSLGYIGN